jgi:hypothetical protein
MLGGMDSGQMRVEADEVMSLPPTPENIDTKLNYIITHVLIVERLCNRATLASENAKTAAIDAKIAAVNAADRSLKALQSREPLSRLERFGTVFAGAATGGALAGIVLSVIGIITTGAGIASCIHH